MNDLQKRLFELSDEKYGDFQSKLTPGIPRDRFIGVRVPVLRNFAKEFEKSDFCEEFLNTLPHYYYDENMLHSLLLSRVKDYDNSIELTEKFLPFVDNWAVCDILSPKVFSKHRDELIAKIGEWVSSKDTYTCRFGMEMLMTHYLDKDFKAEYLKLPAAVKSDEYYAKMMVAWFFATALTKQWDSALPYIEKRVLPEWTHKKTIQKACESYRITAEQKEYLKSLK